MHDIFLDIHGHQIEPGYLVKTANDNIYLAMINPDTGHLEFQRLNKPPDAEVLWWFYHELQEPEIVGRWDDYVRKLEAEVNEHRERANSIQVSYQAHLDQDCTLRCAWELEEALGTRDPKEAARKVRKLEAVAEAAKPLYTFQTAEEHFESARKLREALEALEEGDPS